MTDTKTLALTRHFQTNVEVIRKFLDVRVDARPMGEDAALVELQ